ncbi:hypothetical protein B0H10DRAFT_1312245 [Mycena sp. CBHHK59/15]|nr:hypothetical protein B0H10DRAFT_1312245 [Mycena sp. CBHHK59/15]
MVAEAQVGEVVRMGILGLCLFQTHTAMNDFLSQLLSLGPVTLIPFIPNDALRYTTFGLTSLSLTVYVVHCNTPGSQVGSIEATLEEIEELFLAATTECTRDPRFIAEAGLKLATARYAVSVLRGGTMAAQDVTWKKYLHHLKSLMLGIKECRREMRDLRLSILVIRKHRPSCRWLKHYHLACPRVRPSAEIHGRYQPQKNGD